MNRNHLLESDLQISKDVSYISVIYFFLERKM